MNQNNHTNLRIDGIYSRFVKRALDFAVSGTALIILLPLILVLTVLTAIWMKGNPFFVQNRPGKIDKKTGKEKIFKLFKFRTMTNERDEAGNLLPDEKRLCRFGRFCRKTSLDELPELYNILIGDMSLVGPRPLLVEYLPYYNPVERRRHAVRPGLTGYAQVHGRNNTTWEKRFQLDVEYVDHISFLLDLRIVLKTIKTVLLGSGVVTDTSTAEGNFAKIRQQQMIENRNNISED